MAFEAWSVSEEKTSEAASKSRWWTLALSEELGERAPVAVCCEGTEYVLFRDPAGQPRALLDQCAHRRAPLSLGRVTDDGRLECPYHGWRYDGASGQCVAIPNLSAQERVPRAYRIPSYSIIERDGFIHLWAGKQESADPSQLPASIPLTGDHQWHGSALIAFPFQSLTDLLIDAPGAVLDIPGVEVINDHLYGDPVIDAGHLVARYAANRAVRVRKKKKVPSDYPLALKISLALDGGWAHAQLCTDADDTLAAIGIALTPDKAPLTSVRWRGAASASAVHNPMSVRTRIDAQAVKAAKAFASRLRNGHKQMTGLAADALQEIRSV